MKKLRVYLDTSVIGGCFDDEFTEPSLKLINQIISKNIVGVVSDISIKEIENAPIKVKNLFAHINPILEKLELNEEVKILSNQYLKENIIPEKFIDDATHIAFATVYDIDVLVSWNFKHIVNLNKIRRFNSINIANGYKELSIYTPNEVISYE